MDCRSQIGILKCFFVDLNDLWKFEAESTFFHKVTILMTAVFSEISDFDHFLNIVISDLWVNCRYQNGILKCSFFDFKGLWSLRLSQNFVKNWKFSWLRSLEKFQILTTSWKLSFLTCDRIVCLKMVFLVFFCWFEGFVEVWGWVKIFSESENFHHHVP